MKKDKIFEHYPNLKAYYKTSDGQCFYNEHTASAHAKKLEDKKVKKVERTAEDSQEPGTDAGEPGTEREALAARYEELFNKKPSHNTKIETLKSKIAEKEAELKAQSSDKGSVEGTDENQEENLTNQNQADETGD